MKDWKNLKADVNKIMNKHYTKGRAGNKINKVIVHHNASNLSIQGIYDVWQQRAASAHYQVERGGRIGQLVWDGDTAWHAANSAANRTSIGIEHANSTFSPSWKISDATLDNGAHLVAALCLYYGLGRPKWKVNVFPHSNYTSTACPGAIQGSQRNEYMKRAGEWYDSMAGGKSDPKPSKPKPAPKPKKKATSTIANEVIAGKWGNGSDRRARLEKAGYNYSTIQKAVNSKLSGGSSKKTTGKSVATLAREVIDGKWGNGADRKKRLQAAGHNYSAVQKEVNSRLSGGSSKKSSGKSVNTLAREVIRGDWGNGAERERRLKAAGHNYSAVQKRVNQLL